MTHDTHDVSIRVHGHADDTIHTICGPIALAFHDMRCKTQDMRHETARFKMCDMRHDTSDVSIGVDGHADDTIHTMRVPIDLEFHNMR